MSSATDDTSGVPINRVVLRGRVSVDPVVRILPSGDEIVTVRLIVPRGDGRSDALDASAWSARLRRSAASWKAGDIVEIEGAVRRRFWRTPQGAASRWEIEATSGRRVQRAVA